MNDLIIDNVVSGKLRGSNYYARDLKPFLEGLPSVSVGVGTGSPLLIYNNVFYNGNKFQSAPQNGYYLTCSTNMGTAYYIPLSNVIFTYSISQDDVIKSRSVNGFTYNNVSPFYSTSIEAITPIYEPDDIKVMLTILKHSSIVLSKSGETDKSLSFSSFPDPSDIVSPQSLTLSFNMPDVYMDTSITGMLSLPCVNYYNYQTSVQSFKRRYNVGSTAYTLDSPYLVESFDTITFTVPIGNPYYYLFSQFQDPEGDIYFLTSSFTYNELDTLNPSTLVFRSQESIISHIEHD